MAKKATFDDRVCHRAELDDLQLPLIRSFLKDIKSGLYSPSSKLPLAELARRLNIVEGSDEFLKPRNVGLMFFNDAPENFFPMAQIDVVIFPEGVAGNHLEEKIFRGPLHHQLRDALTYLRNMIIEERVTKVTGQAEAERVFNYPYQAIEEAIVNAVYHRSYEVREPIEIRVNPDRLEIISYPGPDQSISMKDLNEKGFVTRRYRNRRIGEFLKELDLTEGRGTGIPTMRQTLRDNGSPPPRFKTDRNRTYFLAEILIHPRFRQEAQVEAQVDLNDTERAILSFCAAGPRSNREIYNHLGYGRLSGNVKKALQRLADQQLITFTIPARPNSKNQKRKITSKGIRILGVHV